MVRTEPKVTFFLPIYSKIRKHKAWGSWKTFFVYLSREEVLKFQDRFGDVSKVEESLVVSNSEESDD